MSRIIEIPQDTLVDLRTAESYSEARTSTNILTQPKGVASSKMVIQAIHDSSNALTVYVSLDKVNFKKIKTYTSSAVEEMVAAPYIWLSGITGGSQTLTQLQDADDMLGTSKAYIYLT